MKIEIVQYIKLDMANREQTLRIYAKQGDANSRVVRITLYSNGLAWTPPTGATFAVQYKKEDGTGGLYAELPDGTAAVTRSSNELNVNLAPQVLTASGDVYVDVVIIAGTSIIATFNFIVCVQGSPISNADLESQDYYKVASLEQINAALDARVKTVNGIAPDEDGNVQVENTDGSIVLDATLTQTGQAADAKAVGDKIDLISDDVHEHDHAIRELMENKLDKSGGRITGGLGVGGGVLTNDGLEFEDPGNGDIGVAIDLENPVWGADNSPIKQILAFNSTVGDEKTILRNIAEPEQDADAATKGYVDSAVDAVSKQPGTPGEPGKDGAPGEDGGYYTPSVTADGTLSWDGSKPDMPPVQSANIKGSPGADGAPGQDGSPGADGESAYQLAVEAGFTGTLQEWLASLKGAPGQDGADGAPGADGKDGKDGANGVDGGYYTPSVSDDGTLVFMASKQGMPPVAPIDLHEYISTILPGGYCSTGVAVADKIESYISKEIVAGSLVSIQFTGTNTASNPTLTVNGVKAAIVGGNGEAISPAMLGTGERVFLYTTSQKWVLLNPQVAVLPAATAADSGKVATVGSNGSYGLAYPQMPVVATTVTNIEMQPNVRYKWGVATSLTLSFAPEIPGIVNEYCGDFYSGDPATNFVCPLSVNWVTPLNIEVGKHYEFSIINGIGVMSGV